MRAGFFAVIAVVATVAGGRWASGADVSQLPATDPMTWLVKSVCVDANNQPTTEDPHNQCAVGIRKLQAGDPLRTTTSSSSAINSAMRFRCSILSTARP